MSRRRTAGFSLLEALIALTVVVLVAGTLLTGGPRSVQASAAAFRASAAHRLATAVLEDLDATSLDTGTEVLAVECEALPEGAEVTRTVREIQPRLLEVESVVRWHEPGEAEPRTSRLVTLVAQEPLR
jgi:hypothetical protein